MQETLTPGGSADHAGSFARPVQVDAGQATPPTAPEPFNPALPPDIELTPASPPAPPPPSAQDEDFARKFAALSREQKRLYEEKLRLKDEMQKVEAYQARQGLKAKDPLAFLKEEGLEFDQVLNAALKHGEPPTAEDKIRSIEERIENFMKERETEKQHLEEQNRQAQAQREKVVIDNFKNQLESSIKASGDRWEVINAQGSYETVFDVIREHFEKSGEIMPTDTAADLVEDYLLGELKKLLSVKKLSSTQAQTVEQALSAPKAQPQTSPPPAALSTASPTLNGALSAQSAAPKVLSHNRIDRIREAAKLISWNK